MVLYCLAVALGFAALENVTYVLNEGGDGAWFLAIARALLSVPLHALTGALIGVGFARRSFLHEERGVVRVIWLPIVVHGTYDFVFVLPIRNGPYDPSAVANRFFTEDNTVDVGRWTAMVYVFNVAMVIGMVTYAWFLVGWLVRDWRKLQKQQQQTDSATEKE